MSYFLWVEDFENSPRVTASNVFGSVLGEDLFVDDKRDLKNKLKNNGVSIELDFQDGLGFITPELDKKIDYIILDIDLPAYGIDGINAEVLDLLSHFEDYQQHQDEAENEDLLKKACAKLKKSPVSICISNWLLSWVSLNSIFCFVPITLKTAKPYKKRLKLPK